MYMHFREKNQLFWEQKKYMYIYEPCSNLKWIRNSQVFFIHALSLGASMNYNVGYGLDYVAKRDKHFLFIMNFWSCSIHKQHSG